MEHSYISAVGSLISLENSVLELQIFDILLGNQAKYGSLPWSGEELDIVFWDEANLKEDIIFSVIPLVTEKGSNNELWDPIDFATNLPL